MILVKNKEFNTRQMIKRTTLYNKRDFFENGIIRIMEKQLKEHFFTNYKDFILQGEAIAKITQNDLIKDFFSLTTEVSTDNIFVYDSTLYFSLFKEILDENALYNRRKLSFKDSVDTNILNFALIVKLSLLKINGYNALTNKKYFEFFPWVIKYTQLTLRYKILFLITEAITQRRNFQTNLTKILESSKTKQFLGNIFDYKLDFSGSGQFIIANLINNHEALDFTKVHILDKNLKGVDLILYIFLKNFEKDTENFAGIASFLNIISYTPLKEKIREFIFSKKTIKAYLMQKGYNGTFYGARKSLENNIKKIIEHNGFFMEHTIKEPKKLFRMCNEIIKEIKEILNKICPSIETLYVDFNKDVIDYVKKKQRKDGLMLDTNIMKYKIIPGTKKVIKHKLKIYDTNVKKYIKSAERKMSFITKDVNYRKLNNSLGADTVQGLDAVIAYHITFIVRLLNPELRIATIYDAFIFSDHISIKTFKNICRFACQLTFKEHILKNFQIINKIDFNQKIASKFEAFNKNIFDELKDNALQLFMENKFLTHMVLNQHLWFRKKPKNNICIFNSVYLLKIFESKASAIEKTQYINFENAYISSRYKISLKDPLFAQENITETLKTVLNEYKSHIKCKYLIKELLKAAILLHENFGPSQGNDTVISKLNEILNTDDFIRF